MYIPMLKAKKGELTALSRLRRETRNLLTPFVELVHPKTLNEETLSDKIFRSVDEYKSLVGRTFVPYIDLSDIDLDARCRHGFHPVLLMNVLLRQYAIQTIPVLGLDRDQDYLDGVKQIGKCPNYCLRLDYFDIEDQESLVKQVATLMDNFPGASFDCVIDLKEISDSNEESFLSDVVKALIALERFRIRRVSVCGTSFPE